MTKHFPGYKAPRFIHHDRGSRFISFFLNSRQDEGVLIASYIELQTEANEQQERGYKTMIQTVRVYVEDPLQADWDDNAERLVHAIKNQKLYEKRDILLPSSWLRRALYTESHDRVDPADSGRSMQSDGISRPGHVASRVQPTTKDSAQAREGIASECEISTSKRPQ